MDGTETTSERGECRPTGRYTSPPGLYTPPLVCPRREFVTTSSDPDVLGLRNEDLPSGTLMRRSTDVTPTVSVGDE